MKTKPKRPQVKQQANKSNNVKIFGSKKILSVFKALEDIYGTIECPLIHNSPFQLLIAVMLSAQCTDKKVNTVTPILFKKYKSVKDFENADLSTLENIIRPIGLFRAKSANIMATSTSINKNFHGEVPSTMNELISLPGVGRKTANVILGNGFNIPGFPVDTHVIRLTNRIGIANIIIPEKIEKIVNKKLPKKYWTDFSHLLITHGRAICKAQKPACEECKISNLCNFGKNRDI